MTNKECCDLLKKYLVEDLRLEHITAEEIEDDIILFSHEGLGLDSLDGVELVVIVDKRFGVKIANAEEAREIFVSPASLAKYIVEQKSL